MTGGAHLGGAVATMAIVLPAAGFAFGPVFEKVDQPWNAVGVPDDFADDTYVSKVVTINPHIGEGGKTTVYLRKYNPAIDPPDPDEWSQYIALSTRCMHLGCPVRFVAASNRFICPCHGGVYGFQGEVSGGPPVRPLDRFYTKVENGQVWVGPRFSVNSEFDRFSPRDPGEPLDGIGQYLYPSRPSIRNGPNQ
ncbi:MAG: Rieske 2Fe-2S domain-containing protein [Solirubrobacteraceae bacterium]|nr:Rieske 2Fe-2S domain-containing protein [Solirubrobacteraceae bacterium]